MHTLPPEGSFRRRAALGFFLLMTALGAYFLVHGLVNWITQGKSFPVLLAIIVVLGSFTIWRDIISWLRGRSS